MQYISGTLDYSLSYSKSEDGLNLTGYSDADWANSQDRKSTTGYYFALNRDGGISWKSRKQPTVALSTCEAEFMALCETTKEAIYLRQLIQDLDIHVVDPIELYGDNQGAIAIVKNPIKHDRTKHIDIKYYFIREHYQKDTIALKYIPSDSNIADVMTKSLMKQCTVW